MPARSCFRVIVILAAGFLGLVGGAASIGVAASTPSPGIAVHLLGKVGVRRNVHVSFHPGAGLPMGGYYYAVLILEPYKRYTGRMPPPCATSSDMLRTDYGYPHPGQPVKLTLTPARSPAGHWCTGGSYLGGIYAVPHAPPCERRYPCGSEPYKPPSPCWESETGQKVCGTVAEPRRWAYPDGLPRPLASGARIITSFHVKF